MSPCEVCHSKWERSFINLKLLFHLLQTNFFARTFYLQSTSRLFYCYSETTTSLIDKKRLFHVFFPKLTGAPVVTEPNGPRLSDPSRTKGVSAMLKILFWAERVTWLRLTWNQTALLLWVERLEVKVLLQSWKYNNNKIFSVKTVEETGKEKGQWDKVFCEFSCPPYSEADLKWGSAQR